MDSRCARKLKDPPQEFCPAAIARLRWRESLGREPTEQEEQSAPGCPWAIRSQEDMFCFFKAYKWSREKLTDSQIAHMIGVSEATVKKIADRTLKMLANMKVFKEIKESYDDGPIIEERQVDPYEDVINSLSGSLISQISEEQEYNCDEK